MRGRITGLSVIMLVLFALILGQAVFVQVHRAAALDQDPANPRNALANQLYQRGEIVSSTGTVLAESVADKNPTYPWERLYPLGSLTSAVVGYSSYQYGTGGIEYEYNNYLTSHTQPAQSIAQYFDPVRSADTVHLSLEVALQQVADRALAGRDGAVFALNPKTGAVLADYSNPTYNPRPLASTSLGVQEAAWSRDITPNAYGFPPLGSVATQQTFPPGSTFKVITTAAVFRYWPGLQDKSYPVLACLQLPNGNPLKPLCNDGGSPCGGTIFQMLPASCDPGYAAVGLDLGATDLYDEATSFGYDSVPPLDLPQGDVTNAYFPPIADFATDELGLPGVAYSAIGQEDVRATALQGALVAAGIADGGKVMAPHFLERVTNDQDQVVATYHDYVWKRPLTAAQDAPIVPMMQSVVTSGTAYGIFPSSLDVAAKTGTAQTGDALDNTDDWMIAFAPATDPVIAVAVVVPYQPVSYYGATTAGPIVNCVIEAQVAIDAGLPAAGTASTCPS